MFTYNRLVLLVKNGYQMNSCGRDYEYYQHLPKKEEQSVFFSCVHDEKQDDNLIRLMQIRPFLSVSYWHDARLS